ncbi:MAG: hypothetical protein [Caudoviricetes sp.]|nr:MAG: hypothetical protein [Caudoviricetes sp.]
MENPVKQIYAMNNSDFNTIGTRILDYDWNEVCDELDKNNLSNSVDCGFLNIYRLKNDIKENYISRYGEIVGNIIFVIFSMNKGANEIYILNE